MHLYWSIVAPFLKVLPFDQLLSAWGYPTMGSSNFLLIKTMLPLYFSEHAHHQKSLVKLECRTNTGIAITLEGDWFWDRTTSGQKSGTLPRSVWKKGMPEKSIYNIRH